MREILEMIDRHAWRALRSSQQPNVLNKGRRSEALKSVMQAINNVIGDNIHEGSKPFPGQG